MATAARSFSRCAMRSSPSPFRTSATRANFLNAPRQSLQRRTILTHQVERKASSTSPPPPPRGTGNGPFIALGVIIVVAGTIYSYNRSMARFTKDAAAPRNYVLAAKEYVPVYDAIATRLAEKDDYDDGSFGPVLLRLAWHASGTYDKETNTGGSNGATMRFEPESEHGANAGLKAARDFLEPVKQEFPWITYSDLWTLAGVAAIQEMHGPIIPWRPGRADRDVSFCTPDGRLPDASKESDHLRAIFYRMGFNDREIVALSGAHALGRCHPDRSGYDGPWTFSPTVLTNDYFKLLLEEKWGLRKWKGPAQYRDKGTGTLMMLPTDMALVKDQVFRKTVEEYAKDGDKFFEDFRDVIVKLFELGVPFSMMKEEDRISFKPHTGA